ncbi:MAG: hypothetical protein WD771_09375 [Gemmatimonadaceae bacterium]
MRTHAATLGWQFLRQHRWGWVALAAWMVVLVGLRLVERAVGEPMFATFGGAYAFAILVPGSAVFYWLVVVFTFGYSGDLAGRRSIFPPRLLALPVTNAALAACPMLYGGAAVGLLWLAARMLAPLPAALADTVPYLWIGLVLMVLLAWLQAIVWTSYPLPGLRVAVAVVVMSAIQVAEVLAIEYGVSEARMIALLAPQLPLAYLVAWRAVARARRGDVADWSGTTSALGRLVRRQRGTRPPFTSAAAAQRWLEWLRFGRSLPVMVAIVLPVELLILWAARGAPAMVFAVLVIVALTPPFLASFTAVAARHAGAGDDYGVSPFTATRPLSSPALVAALIRVAVWSTAAAWTLVLLAVPAALVLSDTWGVVATRAGSIAAVTGTPRAIVFAALVLAMLMLTTWRQIVQSLYLGLTGRAALVKGSAIAMLCLIAVIVPVLDWAWESGARAWFWVALYWTLGVIIAARMALGSWIAVRLHRANQMTERSLVIGAATWLGGVAAVYGTLLWLFATPYAPRFLLLMLATVSVPLVRVSAAPLALAWNRHR